MSGLASAIDELAGEDLAAADDATLAADLVELQRQRDRLDHEWHRRLAVFDRREAHHADGSLSVAAWLRWRCRLAPGAARDRVLVARGLRSLPRTAAAFASGEIGYAHVRQLVAAAGPGLQPTPAVEDALVDAARTLDPRGLRVAVMHWREATEPAAAVVDANAAHERRRLHASATYAGTVVVDGELDPEGGATLLCALNALSQAGLTPDDRRTPAQRRADALVELARRSLDEGRLPMTAGERPHLTVTVDLSALRGSIEPGPAGPLLDWGGPITAETARRIACEAQVARVLLAGPSQPLDVGRATRTVPPALRRALVARDRGCRFAGCDRPPPWTDAHHLIHWADGGPTSLENLVLLCRAHHRAVHEGGFRLERHEHGRITTHRPDGTALDLPP